MDKIHIRDLKLRAIIGTFPEERREKQDVVVNIELSCDLSKAGRTDDLADTVDYKAIKQKVIALVENSSFFLVEKLASEIIATCLEDSFVRAAKVTLDKPHALRFARSVAVEMERQNSR